MTQNILIQLWYKGIYHNFDVPHNIFRVISIILYILYLVFLRQVLSVLHIRYFLLGEFTVAFPGTPESGQNYLPQLK